eukprot:gene27019-35726_t
MDNLTVGRAFSSSLKKRLDGPPGPAVPQLKNFDLKKYKSMGPIEDHELTQFVKALSTCIVSQLDSGLQLITLPLGTVFPGVLLESSARFLYCRSFYPELLKQIRFHPRTVLLSNPGTGKSMFQWYYLARLLNPDAFKDALTINSIDIPDVVIRQVGDLEMEIYFIKAKVVQTVDAHPKVLKSFDPATTMYFFEPSGSNYEPMWQYTKMSILATCSPGLSGYKEFCKNGAEQFYMPLFLEDELLAIGRHMREQPDFPAKLSDLYSDDNIHKSFMEYGGIIRHVLPNSAVKLKAIKRDKANAINEIDWRNYFANPNIESPHISHFVAKYVVTPPHFNDVSYELVSENVELRARAYIKELTVDDHMAILRNSEDSKLMQLAATQVYEDFVANLLVGRNSLMRRSMQQNADGNMMVRTLYKPPVPNFPFVDFYYKDKIVQNEPEDALITLTRGQGAGAVSLSVPNVQFVGINACFGISGSSKKRKFDTFPALKKQLRLPDQLLVEFLFCPNPSVAVHATATLKAAMAIPAGTVIDVSILQVPESLLELSLRKKKEATTNSSGSSRKRRRDETERKESK